MVKEISSLTDAELRNELIALSGGDAKIGPVTGTTRSLFEKKLAKLRKDSGVTAKGKAPGAQPTTSVRPSAKKATVKKVPASEEESDFEDEDEPMDISVVSKSHVLTSTPDYNATPPPLISTHTPSSTKRSRGRPPSTRRLSPPPSHNLSDVLSTSIASGGSLHASPKRSVDISPFTDRPGQTPPRKRTENASPWYDAPKSTKSVSSRTNSTYGGGHKLTNWKSPARGTSGLLDLGHTTGEEDESDGGQETSRIVYSSSGNRQRDRQDTGRGKIKAKVATLWDSFLGNKFDAGKEPGRHYEMRHGATRTRVDRDPKTNKIKVKHDTIGQDWPQLLLNIFIVFAVLLAVLYVISAHPNEVNRLGKTVTSGVRDSVRFFYQYTILPVVIVFGAALTVLVCYYGQKRYVRMKEEEERAFYELVDQITRMVHESFTDGEPYISQPHVRDLIFPPAKRRGAELARWERAAQFIDESESRIATESRMMPSGHECAVWRWIGGKRKI